MHIVLCLSPVGDSFLRRLRMFPSLVSCCTINWFNPWPEDALLSVARRFIQNVDAIKGDNDMQESISQACVYIHQSIDEEAEKFYNTLKRRVYITPKSYLDLISCYEMYLFEKRSELKNRRNTLFAGLSKLETTNVEVEQLQEYLKKLQPELEEKVKLQIDMQKKLEEEQIIVNKQKNQVEAEAAVVGKKEEQIKFIKNDADMKLMQAKPALEAATEAVNNIDPAKIAELKGFKTAPNAAVEFAFVCVMILVQRLTKVKKVGWNDIKSMIAVDFLKQLERVNEDKDEISPKVMSTLEKFIKKNKKYKQSDIEKGSSSALSLFIWANALLLYSKVVKDIEPLKKKVDELNIEHTAAMTELKTKKDQLDAVLAEVQKLENELLEANKVKQKLDNEVDLTEARLERANKLTSGLTQEHVRWKKNVAVLDDKIKKLIGDVFISSAAISYYAPFTDVYRNSLIEKWIEKCKSMDVPIPISDKCRLEDTMGNPVEIQQWNMDGLPNESVSIANGIIVTRALRKPLMIDPQLQATTWIKNQGEKKGLKIVRMNDKRFVQILENSVKLGNELMIEDSPETLDPLLEPLLMNQYQEIDG